MGWVRAAFRVQRFEVVAAIVIATILAISGVVVWYRLGAVGVPAECWTTWATSGFMDTPGPCGELLFAHGLINGEEAARVMAAMAVVPWLLGFMLGVPLVSREIEGGSAPLVWSLTRSRRRWLAGRLLPVLALLVVVSLALWAVSDLVWSAREPWLPIPSFSDVGLHGSGHPRKGRRRVGRRADRRDPDRPDIAGLPGRPRGGRVDRVREHHPDAGLVHDRGGAARHPDSRIGESTNSSTRGA